MADVTKNAPDIIKATGQLAHCEVCSVRKLALFCPLTPNEIPSAKSYRRAFRELKGGTTVFRQGEPHQEVFTLYSGWAYLYQNLPDGGRQILRFLFPGDFFGFQAGLGDGMRLHSAKALTDVGLCVFSDEDLLRMLKEHIALGIRLTWMTAQREIVDHEHLVSLGRRNAQERIAYLLLQLFERIRSQSLDREDIDTVDLPLTQELIADACGLTQVHVNRVLKTLQEKKVVIFKRKKLHVPDLDRLIQVANYTHTSAIVDQSICATGRIVN